MRIILIRLFLPILCAGLIWLTLGPQISSFIDRFIQIPCTALPLGPFALDPSQFIIGSRRWILSPDLRLGLDSDNRVTLSKAAHTFTFGPATNRTCSSAGICYEFTPDPGDQISFLKSRSWLSWPTPFRFSIMGAPTTSWCRHSYNTLIWKKSSGATIEFVWRDEQSFYPSHGWTDGNLEVEPRIEIKP